MTETSMKRSGIAWVAAAVLAASAGAPAATQTTDLAPPPSLTAAIRAGDRAVALQLLRKGADVNAAGNDGTTALHWAVYKVDVELTKALLDKRANPNVANAFGSTPLAEAVKVANPELVTLLLKAGANVDAANDDGQTALMLAARTDSVKIAELLVARGAKVDAREQWRGQSALIWAAAEGKPDMVAFLVGRGADVNVRSQTNDWPSQITSEPRAQYRPTGGLTPLLYATRAGCERCVDTLLQAGADVNMPNPDGVTPLLTAIDNQHYELAKLLLERGANPHVWDWWGRTALYVATDMSSYPFRAGASSFGGFGGENARGAGADGKPTMTALDLMKVLLAAGVNPNAQLNMHRPGRGGNSGRFTDDLLTIGATPLLRAAIGFDIPAIKVLLDAGALVDLPNGMGVTPLMAASGLGVSIRDPRGVYDAEVQPKVIATMDVLLKAGADINARVSDTTSHTARIARPSTMTDRQGQTAIYAPINWGWVSVVKYMLEHGARVDVADAKGKTPLDATKGNAGGRDFKATPEVAAMIQKAAGIKVAGT